MFSCFVDFSFFFKTLKYSLNKNFVKTFWALHAISVFYTLLLICVINNGPQKMF